MNFVYTYHHCDIRKSSESMDIPCYFYENIQGDRWKLLREIERDIANGIVEIDGELDKFRCYVAGGLMNEANNMLAYGYINVMERA